MCDDIAVLEKERDKLVEQIARLNAEIEVAEGKRAILRYRTAELNGEIEEAQEIEEVKEAEEREDADTFQKLLESDDASALRIVYRQLNDKIDNSRSPSRDCSTWEARVQRRAVTARLKTIEQKEVTR